MTNNGLIRTKSLSSQDAKYMLMKDLFTNIHLCIMQSIEFARTQQL